MDFVAVLPVQLSLTEIRLSNSFYAVPCGILLTPNQTVADLVQRNGESSGIEHGSLELAAINGKVDAAVFFFRLLGKRLIERQRRH